MKNNSISAVIIDDESNEEVIVEPHKTKRVIKKQEPLKKFHINILFGRFGRNHFITKEKYFSMKWAI